MKKTFFLVALLAIGSLSMAQDIKIKKGKVTMTEAQYNELLAKAAEADKQKETIGTLKAQLEAIEASQVAHLHTFQDSASYAIGEDLLQAWLKNDVGVNPHCTGQGMMDAADGNYRLTKAQSQNLKERFQQNFENRQVNVNMKAGKEFMEKNANNKSVYTTASGLQYERIKAGNGKKPKVGSKVKVHYTGTLVNGMKFDSSYDRNTPFEFTAGIHQVIAGWDEGILLMDEGSTYRFVIPYNLGYGTQQVGEIPPGSTLVFEVQLISIK